MPESWLSLGSFRCWEDVAEAGGGGWQGRGVPHESILWFLLACRMSGRSCIDWEGHTRNHCLRPETWLCSLRTLAEGTTEVELVQSRREDGREDPKAASEPSRGAEGGTGDHTHPALPLHQPIWNVSAASQAHCLSLTSLWMSTGARVATWKQPPWCSFCSFKRGQWSCPALRCSMVAWLAVAFPHPGPQ